MANPVDEKEVCPSSKNIEKALALARNSGSEEDLEMGPANPKSLSLIWTHDGAVVYGEVAAFLSSSFLVERMTELAPILRCATPAS
mmetsp:Transcript_1087/g.2134  ORF Transcript_1087/g.2134 Transcript_1087/m.2134 type:complete len:86 (-) Transcript_1087:1298-1555(-)